MYIHVFMYMYIVTMYTVTCIYIYTVKHEVLVSGLVVSVHRAKNTLLHYGYMVATYSPEFVRRGDNQLANILNAQADLVQYTLQLSLQKQEPSHYDNIHIYMYNVYTCMYIQVHVPLTVLLSALGHSSLVDLAAVPPENALNVKSTCTGQSNGHVRILTCTS